MTSLFDSTSSHGNTQRPNKKKCNSCICQLLNQLANGNMGDLCSVGRREKVLIKNKGTSTPASLDGTGTPTEFTVERFDPNNCCAVFSFKEIIETSPLETVKRIFIEDCRSIAGIVCLGNDRQGTG